MTDIDDYDLIRGLLDHGQWPEDGPGSREGLARAVAETDRRHAEAVANPTP